jgi:hypothetical protein
MKKGDLSINIIIVAAIALIILVIISVLIFGTGSNLRKSTSCAGVSGQCIADGESCSDKNGEPEGSFWIRHLTAACPNEGEVCCIQQ